MAFNETWEDKCVKYTINLPVDLYARAKKRARKLGMFQLSPWVRQVLERELRETDVISTKEAERYLDPPRKYHGVYNSLKRSSFFGNWFKKSLDRKF